MCQTLDDAISLSIHLIHLMAEPGIQIDITRLAIKACGPTPLLLAHSIATPTMIRLTRVIAGAQFTALEVRKDFIRKMYQKSNKMCTTDCTIKKHM